MERARGFERQVSWLRHTIGPSRSKNGVAPRTAHVAMRHSSLGLTMNVYTDPSLLDVAGAVKALPELAPEGTARSLLTTCGGPATSLAMRPEQD